MPRPRSGERNGRSWDETSYPGGPGIYAVNKQVPDVSVVRAGDIFCPGVSNLALRCDGKHLPLRPNFPCPRFDGEIAAYFPGKFVAGYSAGYDVPFVLAKAKAQARQMRSDILLHKGYRDVALGSHVRTEEEKL